ncbi:serine phosphatase RsbU (regulator of sigma subunit) [Streptomyces puniciscabiei]|uniref:protein-serine/threonine phosphatase n=1 Tax=Streptomyces puniciscabiei TaxID=164348 RepID=A0A542THE9_9ACTN|nr:SpoIIE family protein phosphatase [Streptomyces puniciscabiei]TQK86253.1 serine phosphatase RsbU (regulator of sigma subunit) [Streptomyces puniciscabiei]
MRGPDGPREAVVRALDALGTGAYLTDEQGFILAVNARGEELLARPASDLVGQDAHDLLHRTSCGEPVSRAQCRMRESALGGRTEQGEDEWLERGDGTLLPVAWLATPCDIGIRPSVTLFLFHSVGRAGRPAQRPPAGGRLSELERLALLAETTTLLTSTLDIHEALRRLINLVVPRIADWAVIDLISERDEVSRFAVAHAEGGTVVFREDLQGPMPPVPQESPMPLSRALRGVTSSFAGPETYQGPPDSGIAVEQRRLFEATGMHSAIVVPLRSLHDVLGALTLGRADQPDRFTATDAALLEDIARRASLGLENARLYQRQRKVAETMQRHLLPKLPRTPGRSMTARYLPAPDASEVGGDWYDAFTLTDGATALAIGDVVGHDLDAAAGMAQLRNMLRAYAVSQQKPPSKIVEWLDRATLDIAEVSMATLVFARMSENDAGQCELSWTNAGHPPPLLVTHEGMARYLTDGHGILLGVTPAQVRPDATAELPPGATLLLYTDGLIESPSHTLDEGLTRLSRHAASLAHRPLESFTDELLARARPPDNDDDVALLAVRYGPPASSF